MTTQKVITMISCNIVIKIRLIKDVLKTVRDTVYYYIPGIMLSVAIIFATIGNINQVISGATNLLNWLISNILAVIFLVYNVVFFAALLITIMRCILKSIEDDDNHCLVGATGEPGSGKTSSSLYFAKIEAKRRWIAVQWEYWMLRSLIKRNRHDADFRKRYIEVATTYYFFRSHDKTVFPMLYTNIPLTVDGLHTAVLTVAHAYQLERVASFCVLFFDEVGSQLSVDASGKGRPLTVSDFARCCRHFGRFKIFFTEQCKENIYIDFRRSVSYHDCFESQKWVYKPRLLIFAYSILSSIVLLNIKYIKYNEDIALFFYSLESYCRKIGFRQYKFYREGSTERSAIKQKNGVFYLPSILGLKYNERLFKFLYQAPDIIKEEFWDDDYIDKTTKAGKYFTRIIDITKEAKSYLKKVQKETNATKKSA